MDIWIIVVYLLVALLYAICFVRIFEKAGYSGALGLLLLIPLINIIMLCVLAFNTWPIENKLSKLRHKLNDLTNAIRCEECGKVIQDEDAHFCPHCGVEFE